MSERELTDAEFWELQYRQALEETHGLQEKVYSLQDQLGKAQRELLQMVKTERKREMQQFFERLGLAGRDAVVIDRDGKKIIAIKDEASKDIPEA
jgi:hypothetical protein